MFTKLLSVPWSKGTDVAITILPLKVLETPNRLENIIIITQYEIHLFFPQM